MKWLKTIITFWKKENDSSSSMSDLEQSLDSLPFNCAQKAGLSILYNPNFFEVHNIDALEPSEIPREYFELFETPRSFEGKTQDIVIDFMGRPTWLPHDSLPTACILGSMGEAGYIFCFPSESPKIRIVDNSLIGEQEVLPSLYHLILREINDADPSSVSQAIAHAEEDDVKA